MTLTTRSRVIKGTEETQIFTRRSKRLSQARKVASSSSSSSSSASKSMSAQLIASGEHAMMSMKKMQTRGEIAMRDMAEQGQAAMKGIQEKLEAALPRLAHYAALPDQEMRNLYIDVDYRINYSFTECFKSFFYFHNETMNIWSHLLSLFGLVAAGWMMLDAYAQSLSSIDRTILISYVLGTGSCLLASVIYHGFGCINRACHDALLNCDLFGVTLNIATSMLPIVWYGYRCNEDLQWNYTLMVLALVPIGLVVSIYGSIDHYGFIIRTTGFLALGGVGAIPIAHLWVLEAEKHFNELMLGWLYLGAAYLIGVGFYIAKMPEKLFPNFTRTTSFSSHTLWHLCVSTGVGLGLMQIVHMQQYLGTERRCEVWEAYGRITIPM